MKVAIRSRFAKNAFENVLNKVARSAASRPSVAANAASQTPGPVSQCKPSSGMRKSLQKFISAWKRSEWVAVRSTE